jgi:hypothetical protein
MRIPYCEGIDVVRLAILMLFVAVVTCGPVNAAGQPDASTPRLRGGFNHPQILQGLTTVSVYVANIDWWLSAHGVATAALKSAVEQQLTAAGLKIVPEPATAQVAKGEEATPPVPMVYIHVKSSPPKEGTEAVYAAQLTLVETAVTKRSAHQLLVSVWDENDVGRIESNMGGEVGASITDLVNDFISDYRKANAQPAPQSK